MDNISELKEQLKRYSEENQISMNRIAVGVGVSSTTLSMWLNGTYRGNEININTKVQNFLNREAEKAELKPINDSFVMTSQAGRIHEILRLAHLENEIVVITGDAGSGKSTAIREYAEKHKDTVLIEADLGFSSKILFKKLCAVLGLGVSGTIHDMFESVVERLKYSGKLIIVDEAEHLPYKALELLRRVYDKSGIGIALVGLHRLLYNLRGRKGEYAQLYSRVGMYCGVEALQEEDTKLLLEMALPGNKYGKIFHEKCKQNCRHLDKLIRRSIRLANVNKREVDKVVINKAAEMLII